MKKIKIATIASLANIISSLAVLISIIILVNEYGRSGVFYEKSIENLVYDRVMELDRLIIENSELAAIISLAHSNPDSLSDSDIRRYLAYEHIFYDSWETLWNGHKDGLVGDRTWESWYDWFARQALHKPAIGWQENKGNFDPEFFELISQDLIKIE